MNASHIMAAVQGSLDTAPRLPYQRHRDLARELCKDGDGLPEGGLKEAGRLAGRLAIAAVDRSDSEIAVLAHQLVGAAYAHTGAPPSGELWSGIRKLVEFGLASLDEAIAMAVRVLAQGQDARVLGQVVDQLVRPKAG
jgi:hypothetical protein